MMVAWEGESGVGMYMLQGGVILKYEFLGWIKGDTEASWLGFEKGEGGFNAVVGWRDSSTVVGL
jgi:hypothetical protein